MSRRSRAQDLSGLKTLRVGRSIIFSLPKDPVSHRREYLRIGSRCRLYLGSGTFQMQTLEHAVKITRHRRAAA